MPVAFGFVTFSGQRISGNGIAAHQMAGHHVRIEIAD